nr:ORF3 [Torque teno felis virus]
MSVHYSFNINYVLRSWEMPYGERCRATSAVKAWFPNQDPPRPMSLCPEQLVTRESAPRTKQISGPEISTPTASSKKKLFGELLELIRDLSDVRWSRTEDDLNLSLRSCEESSSSESMDDSDWEMPPLESPPKGGEKKSGFKYVNFCKDHAYMCPE